MRALPGNLADSLLVAMPASCADGWCDAELTGCRRPSRASQPPACDEAICHQIGVRGVPDPDDRHEFGCVSAAAASPVDRGEPHDRDSDFFLALARTGTARP